MSDVLNPYCLVDINDLKTDLGIKSEDNWDDLLTRIANGVTSAIERMCKRTFVARKETHTLDGSGTRTMFVDAPIISIATVTNDGTALVVGTDFKWYPKTGKLLMVSGSGSTILNLTGHWSREPQSVVIDYRFGYDEQDLQNKCGDVMLAARSWAIDWFQRIRDDRLSVSSRSEGQHSLSFRADAIPPEIKALLQPLVGMGRRK